MLVLFVPRKSLVCERVFQEEGVFGDVCFGEVAMQAVPLDNDVLSLELEGSLHVCCWCCRLLVLSTAGVVHCWCCRLLVTDTITCCSAHHNNYTLHTFGCLHRKHCLTVTAAPFTTPRSCS